MAEQWSSAKDAAYNAAIARGDMATAGALVAERDALIKANDDWHRTHGTGPYAPANGGGGGSAAAPAVDTTARDNASAWLTNVLKQYGLDSLAGQVSGLVQSWGTSTEVIAMKLKDTNEYKTRFKGLLALQGKGVTDVRNEAEYLNLETQYRRVFREAGIQSFLGDAGTQAEYDSIAKLVGDYSLSVNEVKDRVSDAQRVAADTPQEVKDAFKNYYGIDSTALVEYALDPQATAAKINRQANAALAGGYAGRAGLNIGVGTGELIAGLAGDADINQGQLLSDMQDASKVRDATSRLAFIDNTQLTDDEAVQSSMNLDAGAVKKVGTLQSRERARFGGKSGFTTGSLATNTGV